MSQTDKIEIGKRYLIQVADDWASVLVRCWINYDKPCSLTFFKPKTDNYVAAVVTVTNDKCIAFIKRTIEFSKNTKVYDYE